MIQMEFSQWIIIGNNTGGAAESGSGLKSCCWHCRGQLGCSAFTFIFKEETLFTSQGSPVVVSTDWRRSGGGCWSTVSLKKAQLRSFVKPKPTCCTWEYRWWWTITSAWLNEQWLRPTGFPLELQWPKNEHSCSLWSGGDAVTHRATVAELDLINYCSCQHGHGFQGRGAQRPTEKWIATRCHSL